MLWGLEGGLKEHVHSISLMKNQGSGGKRKQMFWEVEEHELHFPLPVYNHERWKWEGHA